MSGNKAQILARRNKKLNKSIFPTGLIEPSQLDIKLNNSDGLINQPWAFLMRDASIYKNDHVNRIIVFSTKNSSLTYINGTEYIVTTSMTLMSFYFRNNS